MLKKDVMEKTGNINMNSMQITLVVLFLLFLFQWGILYFGLQKYCTDPVDKSKLLNRINLFLRLVVLTDLAFLILAMRFHLFKSL